MKREMFVHVYSQYEQHLNTKPVNKVWFQCYENVRVCDLALEKEDGRWSIIDVKTAWNIFEGIRYKKQASQIVNYFKKIEMLFI